MNKLLTKIVGVALGATMAIGVGVGLAVGVNKSVEPAYAFSSPYLVSLDNHASGTNNAHITSASQANFSYDGITWSHNVVWGNNGSYIGTAKTVAQWGSKKKPASTVTLSTTGFANKIIQNIIVRGYCSNSLGPTVSATAGGTTVFSNVAMVQTTETSYTAQNDVAIALNSTGAVVITLTNPNTDGASEKGSGMNIVSLSVKWANPTTQTITSDIDSPYTDESVTLTTNATSASWAITANTAGATLSSDSGKSISVSATQVGSVTVQATASGYTTVSKTISFTARPEGTYYDVTFDSNGGSESPSKQSIAENETFIFPSAGTKAHHTFLGWSSDSGTTKHAVGSTSPAVTANVSYTAYWEEDAKVNVTYIAGSNGSGSYTHSNQYVGTYDLLEFASLTGVSAKSGYRFKNYTVGGVDKNPGNELTLIANTPVSITVNFELIPLEYEVVFGTTDGTAGLSNFNNTSYTIPDGVTLDNIQGNLYGKNDNTSSYIRFGKSGTTGSFDVTISDAYFIKKITANLRYYNSNSTAEFVVTPDGGSSLSTTMTNSFANYDFDISSSYTNKVTFGNETERACLSGFTIFYGKTWSKVMLDEFTCGGDADPRVTAESGKWGELSDLFDTLPATQKSALKTTESDKSGSASLMKQALARYDLVIRKYGTDTEHGGYEDFIGRFSEGGANYAARNMLDKISHNSDSSIVLITAIISTLSLTAIGGYFLLRKKKEEK